MNAQPELDYDRTATQPLFGRRLRGLFGDAVIGLDDDMIVLLERLLDVPGVAERPATPDRARAIR